MNEHDRLETLASLEVCDAETTHILSVDDLFVKDIINDVWKKIEKYMEGDHSRDWKEIVYDQGRRLLFLEELVQLDDQVQAQVKEWLSDSNRRALFDLSPQGDLYGSMLIARALGKLQDFRIEYNKGIPAQPAYVFDRNVVVSLQGGVTDDTKLLEQKLDAVLAKVKQKALRDTEFAKIRRLMLEIPDFDDFVKEYESVMSTDALDETPINDYDIQISKIKHHIEELYARAKINLGEDTNILLNAESLLHNYETVILNSRIQSIRQTVLNTKGSTDKLDQLLGSIGLRGIDDDPLGHELLNLQSMYKEIQTGEGLSSKLKNAKTLTYTLELSDKDPLDVRFGNDSGCCLRINDDGINNAYGLPHNIADNATYIFNIYQQIDSRKKHRVGIVLAFDTIDENENKILACNSLELSPLMNPFRAVAPVVEFVEKGLEDFGRKNGYNAVAMRSHDFNTSQNYSSIKEKMFKYNILRKTRIPSEPKFYSEMEFNKHGEIIREQENKLGTLLNNQEFYTIYDDRQSGEK